MDFSFCAPSLASSETSLCVCVRELGVSKLVNGSDGDAFSILCGYYLPCVLPTLRELSVWSASLHGCSCVLRV